MVMDIWKPRRLTWRPFQELEDIERRLEDVFGESMVPRMWRGDGKAWMPAVDVFEKDDKFVVKAEVPGMKMEDIDVSVTDNTLTIKGEKKAEKETKEENYYRCERSYGSFMRSVAIPSTVDAEKIDAKYEDGVLEVTLPKAPEVKPKKIAIKKASK